jgi:hypothetical protein
MGPPHHRVLTRVPDPTPADGLPDPPGAAAANHPAGMMARVPAGATVPNGNRLPEGRAMEQQTVTGGKTEQSAWTETEPTGWTGWIVFAGVMLVIAGSLDIMWGLVAILNDEWVVWGARGAMYFDITTWGWIQLIVGTIVLLAGLGVMSGNLLARIIAVIVAGLSLLVNFLVLPLYPIWAITLIAMDVFVIFALIAHGKEMKAA